VLHLLYTRDVQEKFTRGWAMRRHFVVSQPGG
jgi:hypothetical protein